MHREALEVQKRVLGPEHPGTLNAAMNLNFANSQLKFKQITVTNQISP